MYLRPVLSRIEPLLYNIVSNSISITLIVTEMKGVYQDGQQSDSIMVPFFSYELGTEP